MEVELRTTLAAIAVQAGFPVELPYCNPHEMWLGIPEITAPAGGEQLNPLQRLALLEHLRRVIVKTAAAGRAGLEPVAVQATLRRWQYLRGVSPEGANSYARVLGYLGLGVPQYLAEVPGDDRR